jgi:YadA head domain repeat (2 copies)
MCGVSLTVIAALLLAAARPAWAAGSNGSTSNPPPPIPTPVITSSPDLSTVGAGGCQQQYNTAVNNFNQQALDANQLAINANDIGLAANAVGAAAAVVQLTAQEVAADAKSGEFTALGAALALDVPPAGSAAGGAVPAGLLAGTSGVEGVALLAAITGAGSTVVGVASQVSAQIHTKDAQAASVSAQDLTVYSGNLDNCNSNFTGTVQVKAGGVNVSGDSIFQDNVGFTQSINVGGNVTASKLFATQGISAFGGAITIGDPSLTTYSSGITIGGGAISGAGTGGLQAFTGDVSAVAIGNNAQATQVGSLALGLNSAATGVSAISIGAASNAAGAGSTAVGNNAGAAGTNSSAFGANSSAAATNSTAVGTGATVAAGSINSTAIGQGATASQNNQVMLGTVNQTYTAPGMNTNLSRSRQSGPMGVVTSDNNGNLASDNGALYKEVTGIKAGAAIAMALADPILTGNESAGIKMNVSTFDGAHAIGASAAGVIARNLFHYKNQLTISAAVGIGEASTFGYSRTMVGGRGSMQYSW